MHKPEEQGLGMPCMAEVGWSSKQHSTGAIAWATAGSRHDYPGPPSEQEHVKMSRCALPKHHSAQKPGLCALTGSLKATPQHLENGCYWGSRNPVLVFLSLAIQLTAMLITLQTLPSALSLVRQETPRAQDLSIKERSRAAAW